MYAITEHLNSDDNLLFYYNIEVCVEFVNVTQMKQFYSCILD